jgi:hypothetical protein
MGLDLFARGDRIAIEEHLNVGTAHHARSERPARSAHPSMKAHRSSSWLGAFF